MFDLNPHLLLTMALYIAPNNDSKVTLNNGDPYPSRQGQGGLDIDDLEQNEGDSKSEKGMPSQKRSDKTNTNNDNGKRSQN